MLRVMLFASIVACSLGAVTLLPRPRPDNRMVGGVPPIIKDYPYQVSFEYLGSLRCGGSIISPDWVVTAAHCVDGISASNVQFRAGSIIGGSGGTLHPAAQLIAHPRYDAYTIDFDVAFARVSVPFIYGTGVQPISLTCSDPPAGSLCVVSGWRTTTPGGSLPSQLQAVEVYITSRAQCNNVYAAYGGITVNIICAAVPGGGKDFCQGGSGGPLVCDGQLAGIASWGLSCVFSDYHGIFSNIATLNSFVTDQTGVHCKQMSLTVQENFKIT